MAKYVSNNSKQKDNNMKDKNHLIRKAKKNNDKTLKKHTIKHLTDTEQVNVKPTSSFKHKKKKVENGTEISTPDFMSDFTPLLEMVEQYTPDDTHCIIEHTESWISQLIVETKEKKPAPLEARRRLKQSAEWFYNHETQLLNSKEKESSSINSKSRKMVLSHGTANDVASALTSYCVDMPVHTLRELERLITFSNPNRKQNKSPIENVMELFRNTYLVDGHIAREFECHSITSLLPYISSDPKLIVKQLVLWYFEDKLRLCYLQFIENLSLLSNQQVNVIQSMAIAKLAKLLSNHPNQDADIAMRKLVNKLGDPVKKIAGLTINQLKYLQLKCPDLRPLMVSLINTFIYRVGVSERSQFYGLCVLADMPLAINDPSAKTLIEIYFAFFTACIQKGTVDNRFMSCLLRGINKACSNCEETMLPEQVTTLYRMCHLVSYNRATQVAKIIFQSENMELTERYYNLIYKMILNRQFGKSGNITIFLNLVYRSMVRDTQMTRVLAFMKRLIQVSLHLPVSVVCAVLKVISQVLVKNINAIRICKYLKGIISIRGMAMENVKKPDSSSEGSEDFDYKRTSYDPKCRNPLYARAELSNLWGLYILKNHYHPSVRAFVDQLLKNTGIDYSGDPFIDFSYTNFLKRYCSKKAKKSNTEGSSKLHGNFEYVPEGARNLPTDSKEFRETDEADIPVDEIFFHKFYNMFDKSKGKSASTAVDKVQIDDAEFDSIMRQKNFGQFVDVDIDEIDFAKSANDRGEFHNSATDSGPSRLTEEIDEEDEEGSDSDEDIFDDLDDIDLDEDEEPVYEKKQKRSFGKKVSKKRQMPSLLGGAKRKRHNSNSNAKKIKRRKK